MNHLQTHQVRHTSVPSAVWYPGVCPDSLCCLWLVQTHYRNEQEQVDSSSTGALFVPVTLQALNNQLALLAAPGSDRDKPSISSPLVVICLTASQCDHPAGQTSLISNFKLHVTFITKSYTNHF
ncbi:hypothetical protein ILYODFUR_036827 [Ilyodon furcidens]|uniref:Uncharacterized protein n=1 Tax=Ilyodon furcidens TaxID=33524 RepID=A0ABV0T399_9TELE